LIDTTELEINFEVFFIESLEERVEETGKQRTRDLLDDFSTGLSRVVFRSDRRELVLVEVVVRVVLVRGTDYEFELFEGKVEGSEDGGDEKSVVFDTGRDELDGSFQVVEESVDV